MNKLKLTYCLIIVCLILASVGNAQKNTSQYDKQWQKLSHGIEYRKNYQNHSINNRNISPVPIGQTISNNQALPPKQNDEEILYSRRKRFGESKEDGVKKLIKKATPHQLDDLSTPETDAPEINPPNWNGPDIDVNPSGLDRIWVIILIVILVALIIFLVYFYFFKNKVKQDTKFTAIDYHADINPENVKQSKLEDDLQNAITNGDFRVAVRIYYLMVLKLLIQKEWIHWTKRKTNSHYLNEMRKRTLFNEFNVAIQIFDWTWYGKHHPEPSIFSQYASIYNNLITQLHNEK